MTDKKEDELVIVHNEHGLPELVYASELPDESKTKLSGKKSDVMDALGGKPDLTECLAEYGIAVRYNVRRKMAEATIDGGEWTAITDRIENQEHDRCCRYESYLPAKPA